MLNSTSLVQVPVELTSVHSLSHLLTLVHWDGRALIICLSVENQVMSPVSDIFGEMKIYTSDESS